ncbi:MAG: VWA domain-containing protein [Lachnospiraceae bacterium]|nr:VWA domain-containing protein [Lachnospiraceae bacterium]
MKTFKKLAVIAMSAVFLFTGCGGDVITTNSNRVNALSEEDAKAELASLLKKIPVNEVSDPVMDIYSEETSEADALADIDTFPMVLEGKGDIDIEIAAPSELSGNAPDDWLIAVAQKFNKAEYEIDGESVSVSIRKISSGEVVTYVKADAYHPDMYIPSNYALGLMLEASGVSITKIEDRIAGNTAGILLKDDIYETVKEKYGEINVANILTAANNGDVTFAYTNPYTSATGLNILTAMLASFDEKDPLSATASQALLDYQKKAPPVAYTTGVLRNSAKKGIINAMVMEEQAYINTPELKDYHYTPAGIRHDHPVYVFDWTGSQKQKAAEMFVKFCKSEPAQKLATEKGFNLHDDYVSDDPGLTGTQYISAQQLWKENKNGGKPIVAVFVADVSGSMDGEPLNSLKDSLVKSSIYIGQEHYIGLVSYSSDVTVNLPIAQFDAAQQAYFSGEVKGLYANGGTATYDACLVAMNMIEEKLKEIPDAKPMIFLLTDGEQNEGYSLNRVTGIIGGLQIPVYTIAYNYGNVEDLEKISGINEAAAINADSDDIVNQLRNLFNVNM